MVCNHEVRGSIPLSSTGSPKPGFFVTVLRYVSGTASTRESVAPVAPGSGVRSLSAPRSCTNSDLGFTGQNLCSLTIGKSAVSTVPVVVLREQDEQTCRSDD